MDYLRDIDLTKFNYARKTNWRNPDYIYLRNVTITEWDIKSAGLSVIKFKKLLPEEEIKVLESLDKTARTIKEGNYQKSNKLIAENIIKTLEDIRFEFAFLNDISIDNVISIKKDAMFLVNKEVSNSKIREFFKFQKKNMYTSFVLLNRNEFLLKSDGTLDVKGVGTDAITAQKNYLLKDITYILKMAEKVNRQQMFQILKTYRRRYLNLELPIDTYRELDSGLFRIGNYMVQEIDESLINDLDISQNFMNYIYPLFKILL